MLVANGTAAVIPDQALGDGNAILGKPHPPILILFATSNVTVEKVQCTWKKKKSTVYLYVYLLRLQVHCIFFLLPGTLCFFPRYTTPFFQVHCAFLPGTLCLPASSSPPRRLWPMTIANAHSDRSRLCLCFKSPVH